MIQERKLIKLLDIFTRWRKMSVQNMNNIPYSLGTYCDDEGIRFTFESDQDCCGVYIYDRESGERIDCISFRNGERIGNVHSIYVKKYKPDQISYQFWEEKERIVPDWNAALLLGNHIYGKEIDVSNLKAGFLSQNFDWQGDSSPMIPYQNALCYVLHVRGFTKHSSSKVSHKGTFLGVLEKLDYLQHLGVTTVELQPAYDFIELSDREERTTELPYLKNDEDIDFMLATKLNYWGYKKAFYYAPKSSYATKNADTEFKEMVKEFHKRGMELVMQFYFPSEVRRLEIIPILKYWVKEYHVDGFHLMGENIPVDWIAEDPMLTNIKIWYYQFANNRNMTASYQDSYLYTMRKFLKGDEGMLNSVLFEMRHVPQKGGRIHYLTNYYGFTLMDLFSYDRKHNDDNGEENRDGNDYNCSWNCGEEGSTRKRKVLALRTKMIKNAMSLLLLSQSTPLIFMGDEFGNTQKGNNNPYCQDNYVAWLNWNDLKKNEELFMFFQKLVAFRKEHPILHKNEEPKLMDTIACGYPDLSYHGENAWRPQTEHYNRTIGLMYCGNYIQRENERNDDFIYIGINMHWEQHELGLPRLPLGWKWERIFTTAEQEISKKIESQAKQSCLDKTLEKSEVETSCLVEPRSISIYQSVACKVNEKKKRKKSIYQKNNIMFSDRTIF